jgi:hypothetical protein
MKYEFEQMAWALNPVIAELEPERFLELGKRLCAERGLL